LLYVRPSNADENFGGFGGTTIALSSDREGAQFSYDRSYLRMLGHYDAKPLGLGGLTLSEHHFYAAEANQLYFGTGKHTSGKLKHVKPFAGGGTTNGGNNVPQAQATIDALHFAFGADGALYYPEPLTRQVRKITPDGIVVNVAGSGAFDDSG